MYPEHIVPLALLRLKAEPNAGELYDGELANALTNVGPEYWTTHADELSQFLAIAESDLLSRGDETHAPIQNFVQKWRFSAQ